MDVKHGKMLVFVCGIIEDRPIVFEKEATETAHRLGRVFIAATYRKKSVAVQDLSLAVQIGKPWRLGRFDP